MSAPQLGKTVVLGLWALVGAWKDAEAGIRLPTWWSAPTFLMAEQGIEKLVELGKSVNMIRTDRLRPYPRIVLTNGGWIEGRSWEQPETLFGPTVARIAVDEFGHLTTEAHAALRSRVSETRIRGLGYMRYAGNVGEIGGEAEAIWRHAQSGAPGWAARSWTWRDRSAAARCECGLNGEGVEIQYADMHGADCERGRYLTELRDLQSRMSAAHFRQLYGAEWLDWSALPAYEFDRSIHVTADVHDEPSLPLDLSCDFNVDPMAWVIGQHRKSEAWALDEIAIPGGATTRLACRAFLDRYPGHRSRELLVYGDASGNSRGTKSTETDYQIIREMLTPTWPRLRMMVQSSNPPVSERINAVNAMLAPAAGKARYYIHPRCESLANDFARVSLRAGTRELDKSNKQLTHFSDADGYRIHAEFPVVAAGPVVTSGYAAAQAGFETDVMTAKW